MNRRRMLSAAGMSIASLSLAGCLEGDDGNGDEDGNGGEDGNGDGDTETEVDVEARIESADDALDAALEKFDDAIAETEDSTGDGTHAIETRPIETLLEDAEADLEAARADATDDQLETIEVLEDVIDFLRDFVEVFSALGDALDELDTADAYVERDRFADAVAPLERAEDHVDDAMGHLTVARSTFEDVDPDALADLDDVDYVEMEIALEEIDDALWAIDVLLVGLRQLVEGMVTFEAGFDEFEAERYDVAAAEFATASNEFYTAYSTFRDAEDDAPPEYRDDFIEMSCQTAALSDAANHLARGVEALEEGRDADANEHIDAAEEALDEADRCGGDDARLSMLSLRKRDVPREFVGDELGLV